MKKFKLLFVNLTLLFAGLILLEIGIRIFIEYEPGYYTGVQSKDSCFQYPFGEICLNSDGYPDDEFYLKKGESRIGYFGDSVCYGTGAGKGYRISDLLEKHYTKYIHYNFCYIGENVLSNKTLDNLIQVSKEYNLSHIVYLMNLNDIPPLASEAMQWPHTVSTSNTKVNNQEQAPEANSILVEIKTFMTPLDGLLRGKSYLYTYLRNKVKERLTIAGYEASGYKAIEMFPEKSDLIFKQASDRINNLHNALKKMHKKFTLVVLPYEMQISMDAESKYRDLNIQWEKGFTDGSAQDLLFKNLSSDVRFFNVYSSFKDIKSIANIGDYFVYNKGDKIDWNHPNRSGHKIISEYLIDQSIYE
jgi:hypothetical protein